MPLRGHPPRSFVFGGELARLMSSSILEIANPYDVLRLWRDAGIPATRSGISSSLMAALMNSLH